MVFFFWGGGTWDYWQVRLTRVLALRIAVFYFLDYSSLFSCPSVSLHSWLRQFLFFLMRTTHEFPRQFFGTWSVLILCRRQSVFHRRSLICPRISIDTKNQQWFEEITRNPTVPCMTLTWAIIESIFEWTSSPLTKNFVYSFIKLWQKKNSFPSIFLDREA